MERARDNTPRLKPRHLVVLSAIGRTRRQVKALIDSIVAGRAPGVRQARAVRFVRLIAALEGLGFAGTNAAGEVWLTKRGLDVIAGQSEAGRRTG